MLSIPRSRWVRRFLQVGGEPASCAPKELWVEKLEEAVSDVFAFMEMLKVTARIVSHNMSNNLVTDEHSQAAARRLATARLCLKPGPKLCQALARARLGLGLQSSACKARRL